MYRWRCSLLLAAPLALAACDAGTGPDGDGAEVAVRFGVASTASSGADRLAIPGDNGTLTLTDLRLVVAEFELDGEDDGVPCTGNDCEDFDTGPQFVDVPLGGERVTVTSAPIPPGTYRELEFEVEDLDDDEEDPAERQRIAQLLQRIRTEFPGWPQKASMLVVGTFQPQGGAARPFRVLVEAEIEVEETLSPPLVVTGDEAGRRVTVTLDPALWFRSGSQVLDLSQFDGRLVRLELGEGFRAAGQDD